MTAPYRGPSEPFPFQSHRTLAEVDCPQRGSSRRLGYDPEPEVARLRATVADKRFTKAMGKSGGSFA